MGGFGLFIILGMMVSMYIFVIFAAAILVISALIKYIFESLFIYKKSKEKEYSIPALSWLPYFNKVYLGKIAEKKNLGITIFVLHIISFLLVLGTIVILNYFFN